MSIGRRHFIKSLGASLGSLIVSGSLSGCGAGTDKESLTTKAESSASEWASLRQCWFDLSTLRKAITEAMNKARQEGRSLWDAGEAVPQERKARHRALLDALVAAGELDRPVAGHMQVAYEEAVYHINRSRATCYMIIPFVYDVRRDFLKQANALSDVSGGLGSATVAQAQAAIAQDMAYFEAMHDDQSNYMAIQKIYEAGAMEASPEALEAARVLSQLLLGRPR